MERQVLVFVLTSLLFEKFPHFCQNVEGLGFFLDTSV